MTPDDDRNTRPTPVPPAPGVLTVDGWQTRQLRALWVLVTLLLLAVVAREAFPRRFDTRPVTMSCPTCAACPPVPPCPAAPPCAACPTCPPPVVQHGHRRAP